MKKAIHSFLLIILMIILTMGLVGGTCVPEEAVYIDNPGVEDPEICATFEEVSQPYLDLYGEPESVEEYAVGIEYYYVEWWWNSQGFMVCFVQTASDNYTWSVEHNSDWITLEEVAQLYVDLYGESYYWNGNTVSEFLVCYSWFWDDEVLTVTFYEDDGGNWRFLYEKWWSVSESIALREKYSDYPLIVIDVVSYVLHYRKYVDWYYYSGRVITFWGITISARWYPWEVVENRN